MPDGRKRLLSSPDIVPSPKQRRTAVNANRDNRISARESQASKNLKKQEFYFCPEKIVTSTPKVSKRHKIHNISELNVGSDGSEESGASTRFVKEVEFGVLSSDNVPTETENNTFTYSDEGGRCKISSSDENEHSRSLNEEDKKSKLIRSIGLSPTASFNFSRSGQYDVIDICNNTQKSQEIDISNPAISLTDSLYLLGVEKSANSSSVKKKVSVRKKKGAKGAEQLVLTNRQKRKRNTSVKNKIQSIGIDKKLPPSQNIKRIQSLQDRTGKVCDTMKCLKPLIPSGRNGDGCVVRIANGKIVQEIKCQTDNPLDDNKDVGKDVRQNQYGDCHSVNKLHDQCKGRKDNHKISSTPAAFQKGSPLVISKTLFKPKKSPNFTELNSRIKPKKSQNFTELNSRMSTSETRRSLKNCTSVVKKDDENMLSKSIETSSVVEQMNVQSERSSCAPGQIFQTEHSDGVDKNIASVLNRSDSAANEESIHGKIIYSNASEMITSDFINNQANMDSGFKLLDCFSEKNVQHRERNIIGDTKKVQDSPQYFEDGKTSSSSKVKDSRKSEVNKTSVKRSCKTLKPSLYENKVKKRNKKSVCVSVKKYKSSGARKSQQWKKNNFVNSRKYSLAKNMGPVKNLEEFGSITPTRISSAGNNENCNSVLRKTCRAVKKHNYATMLKGATTGKTNGPVSQLLHNNSKSCKNSQKDKTKISTRKLKKSSSINRYNVSHCNTKKIPISQLKLVEKISLNNSSLVLKNPVKITSSSVPANTSRRLLQRTAKSKDKNKQLSVSSTFKKKAKLAVKSPSKSLNSFCEPPSPDVSTNITNQTRRTSRCIQRQNYAAIVKAYDRVNMSYLLYQDKSMNGAFEERKFVNSPGKAVTTLCEETKHVDSPRKTVVTSSDKTKHVDRSKKTVVTSSNKTKRIDSPRKIKVTSLGEMKHDDSHEKTVVTSPQTPKYADSRRRSGGTSTRSIECHKEVDKSYKATENKSSLQKDNEPSLIGKNTFRCKLRKRPAIAHQNSILKHKKRQRLTIPVKQQCFKCKKVFFSTRTIKHHMMVIHSRIWTEDCPEGKCDDESLRRIWRRVKVISCPKCDKHFNYFSYYQFHKEWCGREEEREICEICEKPIMKMWLKSHVLQHKHKEKISAVQETLEEYPFTEKKRKTRIAAKKALQLVQEVTQLDSDESILEQNDNDYSVGIEEKESSESEFEETNDTNETKERSTVKSVSRTMLSSRYRSSNLLYPDLFGETLTFMEQQAKGEQLFLGWLPLCDQWQQLDEQDSEQYLPEVRSSIHFTVQSYINKLSDKGLTRLNLFQSYSHESGCVSMFTGGPVWAMKWCPVPPRVRTHQYLAVAPHSKMSASFDIAKCNLGLGGIQIWQFVETTNLSNRSIGGENNPFVKFVITHNNGIVHCLDWCPSRVWQPDNEKTSENQLSRLGLLAAGFSDATVKIFSIPHDVKSSNTNKSVYPLYMPAPVITLVPNHHQSDYPGHCLSLSWSPLNENKYILAGYPKGNVRMWDITSRSRLLNVTSDDGLACLHSCKMFLAHTRAVTGVAWSKTSSRHFITSSHDHYIKLWDFNETCNPIHTGKQVIVTSIAWMIKQSGAVFSCDLATGLYKNHSKFQDTGFQSPEEVLSSPLTVHNATTWDVSVSDLLSCVICSDADGLIMAHRYGAFNIVVDNKKLVKRRFILSKCFLKKKVNCCMAEESSDFDVQNGSSGELSEKENIEEFSNTKNNYSADRYINESDDVEPYIEERPKKVIFGYIQPEVQRFGSYSEVNEKLYMEFMDPNLNSLDEKREKLTFARDIPVEDFIQYPIKAMYSVEFNPNTYFCSWCAYGGQAGIIRVHNMKMLLTEQAKTTIGVT